MTAEDFFTKCDMEGMGYALESYFSDESLKSIENTEVREAALTASDALRKLSAIREELGIEYS